MYKVTNLFLIIKRKSKTKSPLIHQKSGWRRKQWSSTSSLNNYYQRSIVIFLHNMQYKSQKSFLCEPGLCWSATAQNSTQKCNKTRYNIQKRKNPKEWKQHQKQYLYSKNGTSTKWFRSLYKSTQSISSIIISFSILFLSFQTLSWWYLSEYHPIHRIH